MQQIDYPQITWSLNHLFQQYELWTTFTMSLSYLLITVNTYRLRTSGLHK